MKQVILLRTDLDISTGKAVAQGSHASVRAVENASEENLRNWKENAQETKITLGVKNKQELEALIEEANSKNLPTGQVTDVGRTELNGKTKTAGAIGPAPNDKIDSITGDLNLYK